MSTGCQKDRKSGGQTSGQTDRQIERQRHFSLFIKTKVFQNVHRMSKHQSDRKEDIQSARQADRGTELFTVWQRAGQLKSPLLFL